MAVTKCNGSGDLLAVALRPVPLRCVHIATVARSLRDRVPPVGLAEAALTVRRTEGSARTRGPSVPRGDDMHRIPRKLDGVLPVFLILVGLGFAAIGVLGIPSTTAANPEPTPDVVYAETWTLPDLIRNAGAGEVVAVIEPTAGDHSAKTGSETTDPPKLGARTIDGRWAKVQLAQTADQAIEALRALGYARLISPQASAGQGIGPATGPLAGALMMAAAAFVVVGSLMFLVRRTRGTDEAAANGKATTFQTLAPAAPPRSPAEATNASPPVEGSPSIPPVTFDDVAGCDEAKGELLEVIDFLRSPERYRRLGARIPRGVLFWGPPGNGQDPAGASRCGPGRGRVHRRGRDRTSSRNTSASARSGSATCSARRAQPARA